VSLRLHGDTLAAPGMLDFAVNVWPAPRPPTLEAALVEMLADERYPDERPARKAIAARHGRSPEEVLLLNGVCEGFWLLAQTLRPKLAACIHPSFTEPEAALRACGSHVVHVLRDSERWHFTPGEVPEDAEIVVLGNPNNPTGTLDLPEAILALARPDRRLVVDESFIDFVPDEAASLASAGGLAGLVVVRSLSKLWSLAGVRAGYLLAEPDLVERLGGQRQPWSVNGPACAALSFCAADRETPARVAAEVAAGRAELSAALTDLPGVRVWPSAANFLLLRSEDAPHLIEGLSARGIAVRPAASFPGLDDSYLRVAVRSPAESALLVAALQELLA
jgi:histidinol-phosphate/aromatic aminotransferase/cobyric acid decarboxylase-like protein